MNSLLINPGRCISSCLMHTRRWQILCLLSSQVCVFPYLIFTIFFSSGQVVGKEDGIQNGYGGFSLFVGLRGSSDDLQLPRRQCWSFNNNELTQSFWKFLNQSVSDVLDGDVPLVFISFPSAKDSSWEQRYPGKYECRECNMYCLVFGL